MSDLKLVLADFDGTLTLGHELTSHFFEILSILNKNEIPLIVVTGRSQAWGHFLLSHFSLETVITEGGGVISRKKDHLIKDEFLVAKEDRNRLESVTQKLMSQFDQLVLSADSQGRQTDRAIELDLLKELDIKQKVEAFLTSEGAQFSTSNVHLNFWVGEIDKMNAIEELLKKDYPDLELSNCLFFGDSLNDESVFQKMPYTVGVSNISYILEKLKFRPHVILDGLDNAGPRGVLNYLKETLEK